MSAAGPLPPPYPSGQANGNATTSRYTTPNGASERTFAHIEDLKAAALRDINRNHSVGQLVSLAEAAVGQAKFFIDIRRPDAAFVEYLRACEIVVGVVPVHHDYIDFLHDRNGKQKLDLLQRSINSMDEQFNNIKATIISNNQRSGVRPSIQTTPTTHARTEPESVLKSSNQNKVKPTPSPKPDSLHGKALYPHGSVVNGATTSVIGTDDLSDRFAKLRGFGRTESSRPESRASNSSVHSLSLSMPSESEYGAGSSVASSKTSFVSTKPQGPRGMPETGLGPPRPLKLPLETQLAAALPKPPSPTYSPARNMQVSGDINPPRHTARSLAGSSTRKPSLAPGSSASAMAPSGSGDYFPANISNVQAPKDAKWLISADNETRMGAEMLHDYLARYDILLIDFRTRGEFDGGHIFSSNIICIEPVTIRQGISAEEISDGMILAPEEEQIHWYSRDRYQLVVYYDSRTQAEHYLTRPVNETEAKLKYLHEALCDFNQDKPLQRRPMLLVGGIDAWVDLIGNQALKSSSTQAKQKPGRPIKRRPVNRDAHLHNPKRRPREFNPLNEEEERKWRVRAMSESVPETPGLVPEGQEDWDGQLDSINEDQVKYPPIDEFNARFPEAGALGLQTFGKSIPPPQPPPELPAKIPMYPPMPVQSAYHQAPARPAPAAPRMSYTGVSDRVQATPTPRTSSQLVPYIPSKYLSTNLRLPRTGLYNFGSTCYMNATLQALSATTPLTILFLDDQYKGLVQANPLGSTGILPGIYSNFVRNVWKADKKYFVPDTLQTLSGRLNSIFKDPREQQDAQEYFSWIVDTLHEDLNIMWTRNSLRPLTDQEEARRERMPRIIVAKHEWARYTHKANSFLTSLFYNVMSSRIQCATCGATSTSFDPSNLLAAEVPECRETRLQDCLRSYFQDEVLEGAEAWTCPNCKAPRRATKKLLLTRAPPILVICLRRFRYLPNGDQRKMHTAVRFPLEGLDMEEFMLPHPTGKEEHAIGADYGADALKTDISLTPPYIYDAYAVVRHRGNSTRSGHYIAAVKDKARNCWREFNDERYEDYQPDDPRLRSVLNNQEAYLLFYQRRSPNEQR